MTITISGYNIELDYFPGTPGDAMTAPTEEDFDIISVDGETTGSRYSDLCSKLFKKTYGWEISAAIHAKLEEEAAQSIAEDPDTRRMYR